MPSQINKLTVITISFNNLQEVINTIKSVDIQFNKPFEHLIIDGSLNSEVKDYLENNKQPNFRKWICEPDSGIADAFNKGINMANGNILVMLNSGDRFFDENVIETVLYAFSEDTMLQWVHGKYKLQRGGQSVIIGKPFEKDRLYRGMRSICHQSMFVKKSLHDKYGLYNLNQKIAMDYDFVCRIANEKFLFIEKPLIKFASGGISTTDYLQSLKEMKAVYNKYFGISFLLNLWQIRLKLLFYLLKSPIGIFLYKLKTSFKLENI
jgi:glycosyltransferase involved in cell wall biosynthesis